MPTYRADIDWEEIEHRVRTGGESFDAIAADLKSRGQTISKQAIWKRAKKEGWRDHEPSAETAGTAKALVNRDRETSTRRLNGSNRPNYKMTDTRVGKVLQAVRDGLGVTLAAKYAGISDDTLQRWRRDDPELNTEIERAQAAYLRRHVGYINKAGKRGVVQASQWLLERHPMSKEQYGAPNSAGRGSIQVVINVPRADQPITIEGEVIEQS